METEQNKESFTTCHEQASLQESPGSRATSHIMVTCEDQPIIMNILHSLLLSRDLHAEHDTVWSEHDTL